MNTSDSSTESEKAALWKREIRLDVILYWTSTVTILLGAFIVLDGPAGILYYFQADIDGPYKRMLSWERRYAQFFTNLHLLVMLGAIMTLTRLYPNSYDQWVKEQMREAKQNPVFVHAAGIMALLFSFIIHITRVPPGFTDPQILIVYHALTPLLAALTIIVNRVIAHIVRERKHYDYLGVANYHRLLGKLLLILIPVADAFLIMDILPRLFC